MDVGAWRLWAGGLLSNSQPCAARAREHPPTSPVSTQQRPCRSCWSPRGPRPHEAAVGRGDPAFPIDRLDQPRVGTARTSIRAYHREPATTARFRECRLHRSAFHHRWWEQPHGDLWPARVSRQSRMSKAGWRCSSERRSPPRWRNAKHAPISGWRTSTSRHSSLAKSAATMAGCTGGERGSDGSSSSSAANPGLLSAGHSISGPMSASIRMSWSNRPACFDSSSRKATVAASLPLQTACSSISRRLRLATTGSPVIPWPGSQPLLGRALRGVPCSNRSA